MGEGKVVRLYMGIEEQNRQDILDEVIRRLPRKYMVRDGEEKSSETLNIYVDDPDGKPVFALGAALLDFPIHWV